MRIGFQAEKLVEWFGQEGALVRLAEAGFNSVDLSLHPMGVPVRESEIAVLPTDDLIARYLRLREFAEGLGLSFEQVHSPMPSYVDDDDERNEFLFSLQAKSVAICAALGAPYAVIHVQQPTLYTYDEAYQARGKALNEIFFRRLLPHLKRYNVQWGLENLFGIVEGRTDYDQTLTSRLADMHDWIDTFNAIAGEERVVACVDTGHALITGTNPADMIRSLGGKVRLLHVHDNDGLHDQHTAPGLGKIDWNDVTGALRQVQYKGVFCYEAEGLLMSFGKDCAAEGLRLLKRIADGLVARIEG